MTQTTDKNATVQSGTVPALAIEGLCKEYPKFKLNNVTFSVNEGEICGFVGRNGAGKSTTLKSLLGLVHPSAGNVRFFGLDAREHEREIKQMIGFSGGAVDYYKHKKIKTIVDVTKTFYETWDEDEYRRLLERFELDEEKTPSELSEGMKVKLNLALALSHRARLLILDEPTSGLDPFSRAEVLDIFRELTKENVTILFSTHIVSDLEKCADRIVFIRKGEIVADETKNDFIGRFSETGNESLEDIVVRLERKGESNE